MAKKQQAEVKVNHYDVVLAPHITEKSTHIGGAVCFLLLAVAALTTGVADREAGVS